MSDHPEVPVRDLKRVLLISLDGSGPLDITDRVTEIVEHEDTEFGPAVKARYVK